MSSPASLEMGACVNIPDLANDRSPLKQSRYDLKTVNHARASRVSPSTLMGITMISYNEKILFRPFRCDKRGEKIQQTLLREATLIS